MEWAKLRRTFGFRNATRAANAVEQRVFPQIIGRPTDAQRVIEQAGQRTQEIQRAAAQDIEQFVAEQAAAETADITPFLAETGAAAGEAAGVGALEVLGGAVGAPEVAIPAAIGLAAGAGGALVAGVGRSLPAEHLKEQELALPPSQRPATWAELEGPLWAGLGPQRWAWALAQWAARTKARGTCWEATPAMAVRQIKRQTSERSTTCSKGPRRQPRAQPRVQQPMVSRMNAGSDDAPMAQQQSQPRPQVRSRPIQRPFGLGGGSLPRTPPLSGSDASGRQRPQRQARPEPSFNELRREALIRDPELA